MLDKLSALISAMNERYGADLGEPDKVWVDQQWAVVQERRRDAHGGARTTTAASTSMVLWQKIKDLVVERHDKNGVLFDMFFANPDFQTSLAQLPRRHLRRVPA